MDEAPESFEYAVSDLIAAYRKRGMGYEEIISALEDQIYSLKEEQQGEASE